MTRSYWLLIVLGLVLDPTGAKARFDSGGLYESYTDFEVLVVLLVVVV